MSTARPTVRMPARPARRGPLIPTLVVLAVLIIAFFVMASIVTSKLWFDSLDAGQVFTTSALTRLTLFVVFAAIALLVVGGSCWIAWRTRPQPVPGPTNEIVERYRETVERHRRLVLWLPCLAVAVFSGASAASRWQTVLAWMNQVPFGTRDKQYKIDASFYVFSYPWLRYLLTFAFVMVVLAVIGTLVTHLIYGGVRFGARGQRASAAAHIQLAVLLGIFCGLKALGYWLDRYGLILADHHISSFAFTGMTFTGEHAVLPGRTILLVISIMCALLFFANIVRRTWLLPGLGVAILAVASILLGWLWPAIVQQFQVTPNEPDRESLFIKRNIDATRKAFGLDGVKVIDYSAKTTASAGQLRNDAAAVPGIRLMDPTLEAESFEQLQQVRGFYSFPPTLNVDHYTIDGASQDAVVGVREVNLSGLPSAQRNWNNDHTIYTHGYGFVAAYGNRAGPGGAPVWMEKDLPTTGVLGKYEQRIYFGEQSPKYSIVGAPKGSPPIELDVPEGANGKESTYTYTGDGGVPIGGWWNRALYAAKFTDVNFLLSRRIHPDSQLLYDRDPSKRVEKVAPWLTVDSNAYPAVVDGRVKWIIDCYTTSSDYPNAQRVSLEGATNDSLTPQRPGAVLPSTEVNYMRNSVKATVDAYTGKVTLYAWEPHDPVLRTWEKVFPHMVVSKKKMSPDLQAHVRYPEDLFKVQRELLAEYHVTDASTFYQGSQRWASPMDPNDSSSRQPPYYLSVRMPGQTQPHFSLTSSYIPVNKQNLAAFVAVDADATTDDYGKIRILQLSGDSQVNGPGQAAQSMQTDQRVRQTLLALQGAGGGSSTETTGPGGTTTTTGPAQTKAVPGNLLTLPMGGGLLYVQPYYAQRTGANTGAYPLLRLVIVQFGDKVASGPTLQEALDRLFSGNAGAQTDETNGPGTGGNGGTGTGGNEGTGSGGTGGTGNGGQTAQVPAEVSKQLDIANREFAAADKALQAGDLSGYADAVKKAQQAVEAARKAEQQASDSGGASDGSTGGG